MPVGKGDNRVHSAMDFLSNFSRLGAGKAGGNKASLLTAYALGSRQLAERKGGRNGIGIKVKVTAEKSVNNSLDKLNS
ncbi:hypothetical protein ACTQZS_14115 [Bilifractor sp. LCP19S3_H10]|uniref:hypothetical protein n=1 Tax=Bilifractor sp. LCP19S3_H10 TaxID=3438736 RepID=UPI003F8E85EA